MSNKNTHYFHLKNGQDPSFILRTEPKGKLEILASKGSVPEDPLRITGIRRGDIRYEIKIGGDYDNWLRLIVTPRGDVSVDRSPPGKQYSAVSLKESELGKYLTIQ